MIYCAHSFPLRRNRGKKFNRVVEKTEIGQDNNNNSLSLIDRFKNKYYLSIVSITEALRLLELTPPFTKAEVKTAYREAQLIWHPDRFPGNDKLHAKAHARAYLINEAFTEISRALEAGYDFKKIAPRPAAMYRKVARQEPPKSAAEFNGRGVVYQSKGRPNKAIADFTEAIRLDPEVAVYYRNRGIA